MIEQKSLDLRHFFTLTDDTGILSNAVLNIPDRDSGYMTRDNAAALAFVLRYYEMTQDKAIQPFIALFMSFLYQSFDQEKGRFRTLYMYSRKWFDESLDMDQGLCLWALGLGSHLAPEPESFLCASLVNKSFQTMKVCSDPLTISTALIGLCNYLKIHEMDSEMMDTVRLWFAQLQKVKDPGVSVMWALIHAADLLQDTPVFQYAVDDLKSYIDTHKKDGVLVISGASPTRMSMLVGACVTAYLKTKDDYWKESARMAFNWFMGMNEYQTPLIDVRTGGCYEGFDEKGELKKNQIASSTLAWLHALCDLQLLMNEKTPFMMPQVKAVISD